MMTGFASHPSDSADYSESGARQFNWMSRSRWHSLIGRDCLDSDRSRDLVCSAERIMVPMPAVASSRL
jgi:hypothetical protein